MDQVRKNNLEIDESDTSDGGEHQSSEEELPSISENNNNSTISGESVKFPQSALPSHSSFLNAASHVSGCANIEVLENVQENEEEEEEPIDEEVDEVEAVAQQARLLQAFLFSKPAPSTMVLSDLLGTIIANGHLTSADKARYESATPGAASLIELIDEYLDEGSSSSLTQPKAKDVIDCSSSEGKTICTSSDLSSSTKSSNTSNVYQRNAKKEAKQARRISRVRLSTFWHEIPFNVIEQVYRMLSIKERHIASQVCKHWNQCFYSPAVWSTFVLTDATFTRRRFNYYLGYQRVLDPYRTQFFLHKFAGFVRRLIIKPMGNFFNLYEFMKTLSTFNHFYDNSFHKLHTFDFSFGCHLELAEQAVAGIADGDRHEGGGEHNWSRDSVFGTGGKMLEGLKKLMKELDGLRHLALRDLLLDKHEAEHLLDDVVANCYDRLQTLTVINCCKVSYAFLHVGVFLNLRTLVISSQHVDEDVLQMLADTKLVDLYLVQNDVTKNVQPLSQSVWRAFHRSNSQIKLHLALSRKKRIITDTAVCVRLIKPRAQVTSIIYDSAYIPMAEVDLYELVKLYSSTLECVAFYRFPKYPTARSYHERIDESLIHLVENCPHLSILVVREMISTATLLILATYGQRLERLYVRRNAIRKRFDCNRHERWNDRFYEWLKKTSQSYDETFAAVSEKLGCFWRPLSDFQFKQLRLDIEI